MGQSVDPQADVDAVDTDVDALDEELDEAGLLGREELVPEGIEAVEGVANIGFGQVGDVLSGGAPRGDDDLGRLTAAIFWLKTRAHWKETVVSEVSHDVTDSVKALM